MKLVLFLVFVCLLSAVAAAHDLAGAARKERSRRQALLVRRGPPSRTFTDAELERYGSANVRPSSDPAPAHARFDRPSRDLSKEREHWRREKEKHQRELARLDARIRRLEWRLADLHARKRPGERLREDPTERVLEETLQSMREERRRLIEDLHERARKSGALPGWLR